MAETIAETVSECSEGSSFRRWKGLFFGVGIFLTGCLANPDVAAPDMSAKRFERTPAEGMAPLLLMKHPDRFDGRYIVRFNSDVDDVAGVTGEFASRYNSKIYRVMPNFKALWGELSDEAIVALRNDRRVQYIEADIRFHPDGIGDTTQSSPNSRLDRMDQRLLSLDGAYEYSADGTGTHIWIVDNGVDSTNALLAGRVSGTNSSYNYQNPNESCSTNSHGTHMAIAAAGTDSGPARKATIHSARVNEAYDCVSYSTGAIVAALEFIGDYSPRPAVANLSFSANCSGGCSSSQDDAVAYAYNHGVAVVASAGNDNASACNSSPARKSQAITVAASDFSDARQTYSNYGSCVDLFAAVEYGGGTSTAAAVTSGVAALFLQLYPSASPAAVTSEVVNKATTNQLSSIGSGSPNRLLYSRVPDMALTINGGTTVGSSTFCTWDYTLTGGQPPFSAEWQRGGSVVSTASTYTSSSASADFYVELTIHDGVGRSIFNYRYITFDPYNSYIMCI